MLARERAMLIKKGAYREQVKALEEQIEKLKRDKEKLKIENDRLAKINDMQEQALSYAKRTPEELEATIKALVGGSERAKIYTYNNDGVGGNLILAVANSGVSTIRIDAGVYDLKRIGKMHGKMYDGVEGLHVDVRQHYSSLWGQHGRR